MAEPYSPVEAFCYLAEAAATGALLVVRN